MKALPLLLSASILANVALLAVLVTRAPAPSAATPSARARSGDPSRASGAGQPDALRAVLAAGDVAALEAAGLPGDLAREIAIGRIFSRLGERAKAAQTASDARWWRQRSLPPGSREQQLVTRRELADALTAAFGNDLGLGGGDTAQLAFLSADKRDALRRILQDYDEMMAKFSAAGGIQLPSDKEKLRLLKAERDRDIAALLSPEEQLAYEMRTSATASNVRHRYGDAIETEEDFRKIYALQKSFDDRFPPESLSGRIPPETLRQRAEAQRQLQEDLRAALGDEKYAALRRATDGDLRNLDALVTRLNLPPGTTDRVAATREGFAAESQRISADPALAPPQRRAQIQELAGRARSDLVRTLGGEVAEAYAQSSPWVNMLQNGVAYSTTPQPGSPGTLMLDRGVGAGVFPVLPASPAGAGMTRQVIVNSSGTSTGGNENVMTFTTHVSEGTTTPATDKPVITVSPPGGAPPTPPKP